MSKTNWFQNGNIYMKQDSTATHQRLPVGVYMIETGITGPFLEKSEDTFTFPFKVYGLETPFIERVSKTYAATTGNLGILMNGTRGSGKTITAKHICNKLGLPVLVVYKEVGIDYDLLSGYLNSIDQDIIVFIDEYEKQFESSDTLLTIMDGILSGAGRKVFLLTTNDDHINPSMLQRPSRIRYHKTYGDLSLEIIEEVIDDLLLYTEYREDCLELISELDIITIDIVKTVVQEVNIHNESPRDFKDIFNTKSQKQVFDLYKIEGGKSILKESNMYFCTEQLCLGDSFCSRSKVFGNITDIPFPNIYIVSCSPYKGEEDTSGTYQLVPCKTKHHSFTSTFLV